MRNNGNEGDATPCLVLVLLLLLLLRRRRRLVVQLQLRVGELWITAVDLARATKGVWGCGCRILHWQSALDVYRLLLVGLSGADKLLRGIAGVREGKPASCMGSTEREQKHGQPIPHVCLRSSVAQPEG